jgi:anti-repressor protein
LAKLIKQNGVDIGQNRLYTWLRENGYLIKSGSDKYLPTQKAMNMNLFEIKEGTRLDGNGVNVTTRTTKVTGKGQIYFVNKFLGRKKEPENATK